MNPAPALPSIDGVSRGVIGIADPLRPEATGVVARLRGMGLEVVMLTGDRRRTAEAIAAQQPATPAPTTMTSYFPL